MASGIQVADLFASLGVRIDSQSFGAADKLLGLVQKGLGAIAAYASFNWAKGLISQTMELGGTIADLSQKVGVPAETLQQLGYAAEQSDSSMEALGTSLGKVAKLAFDAKKGGGEAAETFKALGVRVTDAEGALRPAEDLFTDIADTISKMPDGTEKTALAMRVFGRSGKELIPLLNEGSEGINKLRQEFLDLGLQISGEDAKALEAFGDQVGTLGRIFEGVRNQAVIALLPHLREVVTAFIEWYKANRLLIRARIDKILSVLIPVLKIVVRVVKELLITLGDFIDFATNWVEILIAMWKEYNLVIAAATGAMLAYKAAAIGAAVASAAAWAVPLATIAAFLLLAEDLWVWSQGGDSLTGRIHKGLVDLFVKAIEFWVEAFGNFFDWLDKKADAIAERIREILPAFLGGYSSQDMTAKAAGLDPSRVNWEQVEGVFFSPTSTAQASIEATNARLQDLSRVPVSARTTPMPSPAAIAALGGAGTVNASFVINGANDPNEVARQVQVKLEGILRTAKRQMED